MSAFVTATEPRFNLTLGNTYQVRTGVLQDDVGLPRDAAGLVAAGVAIWVDDAGQPTAAPTPQQDGQHYVGIYDTEILVLVVFARCNTLPLAIVCEDNRVLVNVTASPWVKPLLIQMRAGVVDAVEMVKLSKHAV